jgi:pimeloyl-ACP methyl ester carboxylesterase
VVALAPGGGWAEGDPSFHEMVDYFPRMHALVQAALPHVDAIASSREGRRRATAEVTERFEHIPPELVAHFIRGAGSCDAVAPFTEFVRQYDWTLDAERIECPVRIVWGTADKLLPWPAAAARWRAELPWAEWIELDGVGHCPQLDVPMETAELILGFSNR